MNTNQALSVVQWVFFICEIVFSYGPKLMTLLIEAYQKVELWANEQGADNSVLPSSNDKRVAFARHAVGIWKDRKGDVPTDEKMAQIVAYTWRRANGRKAVPRDKDKRKLTPALRQVCARRAKEIRVAMNRNRDRGVA